jgi:uncharacterized protein RhaS with RHS repeats
MFAVAREVKGSTTKTYSYDADDRLWDTTIGTAGMRYGYDNNGNRKWAYDKVTGVNITFAYDNENRLTARGTCTYTYAPNGERMSSACSAPTCYRYDSARTVGLPIVTKPNSRHLTACSGPGLAAGGL